MRVEILGEEQRRRWGNEKKDIVMSVGVDGATVTEVAHRHDVTRQQIHKWRRELRMKGLLAPSTDGMFLRVDIPGVQNTRRGRKDIDGLSPLIELQYAAGGAYALMLVWARRTPGEWNDFLDNFVERRQAHRRGKKNPARRHSQCDVRIAADCSSL
ncbi:transposase [Rhizobium mongolense]|uniref:transposase n=1 Tax=Rhizobium mongolense TaxID=57676 RepID=UPI0035585EB3